MLIFEYKLDGSKAQYTAIDEAIRIVQFIRNKWTPRRMMLEKGAHSNWAKKLVSSPRLIEGLSPFLGMGADCR